MNSAKTAGRYRREETARGDGREGSSRQREGEGGRTGEEWLEEEGEGKGGGGHLDAQNQLLEGYTLDLRCLLSRCH